MSGFPGLELQRTCRRRPRGAGRAARRERSSGWCRAGLGLLEHRDRVGLDRLADPAIYRRGDEAYREWLSGNSGRPNASLGGSYDSDDIQDYYQTRGTSGTAKYQLRP